ncbi:MAG: M24 family metallopeptidase [Brevefilum sp.]
MNPIVIEKSNQIPTILAEQGLDLWLVFVRETSAAGDPVLPLIYGEAGLTWQSALLFTPKGEKIAILGRFEVETAKKIGAFERVIPYDEDIQPILLAELQRINPSKIAVNYSEDDVLADGLTHGLFLNLQRILENTPYADRLVSAQEVISALRGRKSKTEVERIKAAIASTMAIFDLAFVELTPGQSEIEVAQRMQAEVEKRKLGYAWPKQNNPAVNTGPNSPVGHNAPTDLVIEPGHLLHFDFGVKQAGYCADIQRMVYFLEPGQTKPPEPVRRGFETVVRAIQAAFEAIHPGVPGIEVDRAARTVVTEAGFPEYKYATGHQLGRLAHDGGALLGPAWARYGKTPFMPIEAGQVYTLEPGLMVPGYGYVGIEEDILVTDDGAQYLAPPQTTLILK